ncbi:MAG: flippase-like domain-containing protein [Elusimicrobia bacterium]|nr:flippase-like domain-containing protein [Elusimicrobiota bacterium]
MFKTWVLPLGITAALLGVAFSRVNLQELRSILTQVRPGWLAPMIAMILLEMALRAKRWTVLLSTRSESRTWELFRIDSIGAAVNNLLFLRIGEFARGVLASRRLAIPLATVFSSIAIERALDLSALLAVFALASALATDLVPSSARHAAMGIAAAAFAGIAAIAASERALASGGILHRVLMRWPRILELARQLSDGASALRSTASAAQITLLTIAFWSVDIAFYWTAARFIPIETTVTFPRAMLIVSWAGAGTAVPAAPGSFGPFEAAVQTILMKMGAGASSAFGYATLSHAVGYSVVTLLGIACLYALGLSVSKLHSDVSRTLVQARGSA